MNDVMKTILLLLAGVMILIGGFYIKKWFNYTFFYEDSVKTEMRPLEKRVDSLEHKLEELTKKIKKMEKAT